MKKIKEEDKDRKINALIDRIQSCNDSYAPKSGASKEIRKLKHKLGRLGIDVEVHWAPTLVFLERGKRPKVCIRLSSRDNQMFRSMGIKW